MVVQNFEGYISVPKLASEMNRMERGAEIIPMDQGDDFEILVSHQRHELMAAAAANSDLDLAFEIQMEEAMTASIAFHSSSSSAAPKPPPQIPASSSAATDAAVFMDLQAVELERFQQERGDGDQWRAEMRRISDDLRRRAHDEQFAREVSQMPDEEWEDVGDEFERPMGPTDARPFRLYFKGMESKELVGDAWVPLAALGIAVCDPGDNLVLQIQKPAAGEGIVREALEMKALIEGLNAVVSLGIKRIDVFTDYGALYKHIMGEWTVRRKLENLMSQLELLKRKFDEFRMGVLPRCRIKFVFKFARDVIDSQITKNLKISSNKNLKETCNICLEDTESYLMFAIDGCLHRFCFSCMQQHVEVKLLHGMLPNCPHAGCDTKLNVENSRKFLSPKLLDIMIQRVKEAAIPVTEKVYCPYPKCSALMSLNEAISPRRNSTQRQCIKCNGSFCVSCRVPWHAGMSCYIYKRQNPGLRSEEEQMKSLARKKLWRQCVKCKHMIELVEGCFHMTCRCGYEFCYVCGGEWREKKATCACPLWDEGYIVHDVRQVVDDFFDEDEDDDVL